MKQLTLIALLGTIGLWACGGNKPDDNQIEDPNKIPTPDAGPVIDAEPPPPPPPPPDPVDIRADTNRDGVVSFDDASDDEDEEDWNAKHGAIFLANIDDDERACPYSNSQSDVQLAKCHDAADDVINGAADVEDLAPIRVKAWPEAPDGTTWHVTVSDGAKNYVNLFLRNAEGDYTIYKNEELDVELLRAGADFAIEGKDIVRDRKVWDGYVDLTLEVEDGNDPKSDRVRLRVAPLLTHHHLQPAQSVYTAKDNSPGSTLFVDDLKEAASAAKLPKSVVEVGINDQWIQDYFETGYMVMPTANGGQKVIHVFIRSANVYNRKSTSNPLRPAGRIVFSARGKDVAAVQEYDLNHDPNTDSLNSMGNFETVPPYSTDSANYPMGRMLRGSIPSFAIDKKFSTMMEDQGVQPAIKINTSWLLVGHVDETVSFVKSDAHSHGWAVLVNDAAMAVKMLEDAKASGNGTAVLFAKKYWLEDTGYTSAQTTISKVLDDTEVMAATAEAVVEVDDQIDVLKKEVGLVDEDFISVPFTHYPSYGYSLAHIPGMVNGIYLSDKDFGVPKPYGPSIDNVAIFDKAMIDALAPLGIATHFIEDWDLYHRLSGEVHCGTNTVREIPQNATWWEVTR